MSAKKIILDCDPGHDDAIAILLMLASQKEIECLGITVSAGNVSLDLTATNSLKVLSLAKNTSLSVYKGCPRPLIKPLVTAEHVHGETGLDTGSGNSLPKPLKEPNQEHAVNFIIKTLHNSQKDEISLVATGPLTNIAAALAMDPVAFSKAKQLIIMGGAGFEPGNITPAAEFNIFVDPHAARSVFESGIDIVMFGLDVTHQMIITPERLKSLSKSSKNIGPVISDLLTFFNSYDTKKNGWSGAPLHDPCTIAWLIDRDIFKGRKMSVKIETNEGPAYGRTIADWFNTTDEVKNVYVITEGNSNKFFKLLTSRFNFFDNEK